MNSCSRALAALALGGACLFGQVAVSEAATTHSGLRVEAASQALEPGTNYSNRSITSANSSACGDRDSREERLSGANAMGLVGHAARVRPALDPFRTSDTFDFGLIVCRIGDFAAFDTSHAWLYKIDHEFASIGADQLDVGRSSDVLWYFANFSTGANTGDELDLSAPDRTRPAEPVTVTAYQYDGEGNREPAAGVTVSGGATPAQTGADGEAVVTFTDQGFPSLRGTRGDDIPAAPEPVCVASNLSVCAGRLGERYVGTNEDDLIRATDGADHIRPRDGRDAVEARDEDDRIDVSGGGGDTVDCGDGRDVVDASSNDRLERDCEVRR